jgi:predicted CXXCH cytochrome family protein
VRAAGYISLVLVVTGILVLFTAGCDKYTKHEVLTFFFTGVPSPDEKNTTAEAGKRRVVEKPKKKKIPVMYIHGPKAAGECFHCHNTDSTQSFRTVKRGTGMPKLTDITPGRLTTSKQELCIQCHATKSAELMFTDNLWVHGPLADGLCTACHDYHATKFPYMLFSDSSIVLCTQCHEKGYITQIEEHIKEEECISCHNPHMGANRLLLKKDYDEVF